MSNETSSSVTDGENPEYDRGFADGAEEIGCIVEHLELTNARLRVEVAALGEALVDAVRRGAHR